MRAGSKRNAQDWALAYAEGIDINLKRKRDSGTPVADLFRYYPTLEPTPRGKSVRMCQEINLAKKQLDAREQARADDSRRLVEARAKQGVETGEPYKADILVWVLKTEEVELKYGQEKTKDDPMVFYVSQPTGRARSKGIMFEKAMEFLVREGEHARPAVKADPFAEYLAVVPAPQTPVPAPVSDPQEDLLASLYGTKEENKP